MTSSTTMKAVGVRETEGRAPATALMFHDIAKPKPSGSQVIVKIKAFGLNRMDILERQGLYPVPPQAPKTMGVEFSGVIDELGPEANSGKSEHFKVGDEVFGLAYGGAYAQYIAVSTHMLLPKPKELSWEECAGIPEVWITAIQALYLIGEFSKGKSVLWHAGASSVGIAGIQLSQDAGASAVYATTRSDDKNKWLREERGVTASFNTNKDTWAEELKKETDGKGVDIIIDFIGGSVFKDNVNSLARDGHLVHLAFMGGSNVPSDFDISVFLLKRIRIEGSSLRSRDEEYQGRLRNILEEKALPQLISGKFEVVIEKITDWKNIVEAHQLMESNKTKGKIVCTIPW